MCSALCPTPHHQHTHRTHHSQHNGMHWCPPHPSQNPSLAAPRRNRWPPRSEWASHHQKNTTPRLIGDPDSLHTRLSAQSAHNKQHRHPSHTHARIQPHTKKQCHVGQGHHPSDVVVYHTGQCITRMGVTCSNLNARSKGDMRPSPIKQYAPSPPHPPFTHDPEPGRTHTRAHTQAWARLPQRQAQCAPPPTRATGSAAWHQTMQERRSRSTQGGCGCTGHQQGVGWRPSPPLAQHPGAARGARRAHLPHMAATWCSHGGHMAATQCSHDSAVACAGGPPLALTTHTPTTNLPAALPLPLLPHPTPGCLCLGTHGA